ILDINRSNLDRVTATFGAGDDSVTIQNNSLVDNSSFDGGAGFDTFTIRTNSTFRRRTILNFESPPDINVVGGGGGGPNPGTGNGTPRGTNPNSTFPTSPYTLKPVRVTQRAKKA
ncbi:MAG: hypothetical protein SFU86_06075, partial [Pirellulaceae bacterium]|nr:hypothetical protein [Pirellulaceae bacterium]